MKDAADDAVIGMTAALVCHEEYMEMGQRPRSDDMVVGKRI